MTDLRVWLALAGLLVLALTAASFGVRSALAPFCAVGVVALWLALAGSFGWLLAGGWVLWGAIALCAGLLVYRHLIKKQPLPKLGFGFWFFAAASAAALALLACKQPMFLTWDEFSSWGVYAKLTKLNDALYTTAPAGWIWPVSQTPALFTFEYFFQFLGAGFVEWQVYAAVDVFLFAALAAVLAPIDNAETRWNLAMPAAVAGLLVPYIFTHYRSVTQLSPVYIDSLADVPMGFAFAAALACWFFSGKKLRDMLPVCVALATLTLTKDIAVSLALVATVMMLADGLLGKGVWSKRPRVGRGGPIGLAFARFGLALGSVVAAFGGWSLYQALVLSIDRVESVGGVNEYGLLELPGVFFRDLLSPEKSDFFIETTTGMARMFFTTKATMLGTGLATALVILAMVALAAVLAGKGAHRRRCWVFGLFGALGFVPYYLLITMSFLYIFRPEQVFIGYERYLYPYYIAWFLAALGLLCYSVANTAGWRALAGRAVVLGLAAVLLLRVAQLVPPAYTVFGVHPDEFNTRRAFTEKMEALQSRLDPDGRTFLVAYGDPDGGAWFRHHYQLLPWLLDYSFSGVMEKRERQPDGTTLTAVVGVAEWAQYLLESGCTTVYIDSADEAFREAYGLLFTDDMAGYFAGETDLYAVEALAGGGVALVPITAQVAP